MKHISREELCQLIAVIEPGQLITLITRTTARCRVGHKNRVRRVCSRLVQINANYRNYSLAQEDPEDIFRDFLWNGNGEHITPAIVQHKKTKKIYIAFRQIRITQDTWLLDDKECLESEAKKYMLAQRDDPRPWRVISLENILAVTVQGKDYVVAR